MTFEFHGTLTYEEFLLEWFGYHGGRELANPDQRFTYNPKNIIGFISQCKQENKPAYMSVAYRRAHDIVSGIDRIFFDFDCKEDDADKKLQIEGDVRNFIRFLETPKPPPFQAVRPLTIKTFHGYHVWVFLKTAIMGGTFDQLKKIYFSLQKKLQQGRYFETIDGRIIGDVKRLGRIPLSWHEKGAWCQVVDNNLNPTKVRGLDFYRLSGLVADDAIADAKLIINANREIEIYKDRDIPKNSYGNFQIRPCFMNSLKATEMGHQQRLAFVIEAYWASKKKEISEIAPEIIDLFRKRHDFDLGTTDYQVNWQLRKINGSWMKPYRCKTMKSLGWCLGKICPYFK